MSFYFLDSSARSAWLAATTQQAQLEGLRDEWSGQMSVRYYSSADAHLATVTHETPIVDTSTTPYSLKLGAYAAQTDYSVGVAAYCVLAVPAGADIARADCSLAGPGGAVTNPGGRVRLDIGTRLRIEATSTLPATDDNLLNFNEGMAATGWAVTSGSGTLSQAASSVRLTSTTAAVVADLSIAGPTANDFIILVNASAKYTSGQYGSLRFKDGATTMLELSLGYNHLTAAEALGTISVTDGSTGNVLSTGVDYETTPQKFAIHIDRNYSAVNVYAQHSGGGWLFQASYTYAAGFASLDSVQMVTSADSGQWIEYDWLGYARPNIISIGDSICAGHNTFDPDPAVYGGEDNPDGQWQRWCVLSGFATRNTLIVNKGIGGETSTQILARITAVTAHSPRLMFLHASTNDQVNAVSKATRSSNIQACIDAMTAIGGATVLLNAMYGTSGNGINPAHRTYMADWWASDRLALTGLLAQIDIMVPMDSAGYMNAALTEGDGIHPTPAGYQAIGEYIQAEMP